MTKVNNSKLFYLILIEIFSIYFQHIDRHNNTVTHRLTWSIGYEDVHVSRKIV